MKRKYPTETLGPNKRPRGTISGAAHRSHSSSGWA